MQAMPVRPTAETMGVTPAVARQYNIAPSGGRPAAPGPVVRPEGGRAAPVVLRAPGGAPVLRDGANGGQVARPGEAGHPDTGRPDIGRVGAPGPVIVPHEGEPAGHGLPPLRADVPGGAPGMARPGEPARPMAPEGRPAVEPPHAEAGGVGRPPVEARPTEMPHGASPAPHPEARPEPRPVARPEAHPEARPEPHYAPRPEGHPEARPESRPGMQHVAAPQRPAPQRREEERRP
jgi:hypothetical protein